MFGWKSGIATAVLLLGVGSETVADVGISFGAESFRWREYDAGERLLEESGPRFHLGGIWRQPFGADQLNTLEVRGTIYFGQVDYDGQACDEFGNCSPFDTDTEYSGAQVSAVVASRFGGASGAEVFGGGGVDTWERDIKGRGSVQWVREDWITFYVMAGGGAYWTATDHRGDLRLGIKYPFYTLNDPNLFDVTLEPKGRASVFVRYSTDFLAAGRPRWGLGAYFDTYRFAESDKERDGNLLVWQPKSSQDTLGVYGIVYLR